MSKWTHAICQDCWDEQNPDRQAVRVVLGELERCCYCLEDTASGIYVRADPDTTGCEGVHDDD